MPKHGVLFSIDRWNRVSALATLAILLWLCHYEQGERLHADINTVGLRRRSRDAKRKKPVLQDTPVRSTFNYCWIFRVICEQILYSSRLNKVKYVKIPNHELKMTQINTFLTDLNRESFGFLGKEFNKLHFCTLLNCMFSHLWLIARVEKQLETNSEQWLRSILSLAWTQKFIFYLLTSSYNLLALDILYFISGTF